MTSGEKGGKPRTNVPHFSPLFEIPVGMAKKAKEEADSLGE